MREIGGLSIGTPLACVSDVSERTWALAGCGQLEDGDCLIVDITGETTRVAGLLRGASGDVFACSADDFPLCDEAELSACADCAPREWDDARALARIVEREPAVHVIGSTHDATGQITVRQPAGNYLRACRWDKVDYETPGHPHAVLRTLPQCGCGGSLGSPKLFDSFAEMVVYHFCAFCV